MKDKKWKLLFFSVVNAIQQTKNGPWYIQIAVAKPLMKDYYPFHFPPSFFFIPALLICKLNYRLFDLLLKNHLLKKLIYFYEIIYPI